MGPVDRTVEGRSTTITSEDSVFLSFTGVPVLILALGLTITRSGPRARHSDMVQHIATLDLRTPQLYRAIIGQARREV